jgi:PAS domain S-box-containing protein
MCIRKEAFVMVESIQSSDRIVSSAALKRPIRVLHVDDDPSFLKVAKQCLETQGEIDIDTVSSVNEASEKLKKTDYDVIVSDYQMPGKDCLEFLKELREKGNTVPFIVFTGKGREETAVKALNLGADGYFSKHGEPETVYRELAHGIRQVVGRRRAEQSFSKSEDKYRRLVETLHEGIWVIDKDSRTTFVNPRMAEILGYETEEMKGRHLFSFMDERDVEIAERLLERRKQNIKEQHDFEFLRKDGTRVYATLETTPITDDNGNYNGALASVMDITERKKAEQALEESEDKYRSLVELAPDGIVAVNAEGIVTSANRSFLTLVGYDSEEGIVGKPFTELVTMQREDIPRFQGMFMSLMKGESPSPVEFLYVRRDGTSRWAEVHPSLMIKDGNPVGVQAIMRDVSERKKAKKTLQESEERFKAIFEGVNDGILLADTKAKRFFFANPRICEITGYSLKELLKLGIGDIHPKKDLPYVIDSFTKLAQGKLTLAKDIPVLGKDERVVYCDISARSVKIGSQEYLIGLFRDVTEERTRITELKNTEERLKETNMRLEVTNEKLHVVGGLTRHDVRNKLSAVTGNAYLLRQKLAEDPKALEQLKDMEAAVRLVEKIFEFAGNYEKLGVEKLAYMDVGKAVEGAVSLFSDLKGVKVGNECGGLTVLADSLLNQLFYNLVDNSLKYGEKIRQIKIHYKMPSADQLELVYEDDGVGIPDKMRSNLFKEGFTSGKGTGYGLFMIKRICEVYGWTIQETGKQGKGAQFTMLVPRIGSTGRANYQIQKPRRR